MKRIVYVVILYLLFVTSVKAFSIDASKIEINSKGKEIISSLDSKYNIESEDFESSVFYDAKAQDLARKLVEITASNKSVGDKTKALADYMFISSTNGFDTISGSIFIQMYLEEVNSHNIKYGYIKNIRTISFNENDVITFVYIKDCEVDGEKKEIVLSYWLKIINNEYKLFYPYISIDDDLEDHFDKVTEKENQGVVLGETYNKISIDDNKSKVEDSVLMDLYNQNVDSVVQVTSMHDTGANGYGSGFFIREGIVVISWQLFSEYLNSGNLLYVNDAKGNTYEIDGVVAAEDKYGVAILKLKNEAGKKVSLENSECLKTGDKLFTINSKANTGFSINYGDFVSLEKGKLENLFAVSSSDVGSALFNKDGKVVAFVVNDVLNSDLSYGHSTDYLVNLQKTLSDESFNSIKCTSLDGFKERYYLDIQEEKTYNNIPDKVWNEYKDIGKLEENIELPLIKASYVDKIVSLRYKNSISNYLDTMYFVADYCLALEDEGYKLTYSDDVKKIYTNGKTKIVIKDDLSYLIILMMEA